MKIELLTFVMIVGVAAFTQAQETENKEEFAFSGYADVNYFSNLNSLLSKKNTGVSGFPRVAIIRLRTSTLALPIKIS
jgi:hypothetical protein